MIKMFKKKESEFDLITLQQRLSRGASVIGVDIGASAINVAQVVKYKGRATVIKTCIVAIKVKPGEEHDEAALRALYIALEDFPKKSAKFVCVVNCPQTCVRSVIMPRMPEEDLYGAVRLEVKKSIPFPLEDAALDFNIREDVLEKGVSKMNVVVAASPQKTIDRLISFFQDKKAKPFSGRVPKKFDNKKKTPVNVKVSTLIPLALCLENIIECSKLKTQETLMTLEISSVVTELNIYQDSRLQFSRKIPFSGQDITKSLMGALMTERGKVQLSEEEAEVIKKEYGIPKIEDNRLINEKITTNQILSLVRPVVEHLAKEIERSFDFFQEEMHGQTIDRIVLFGGGAQLKGLPDFLSKELDVEVSVGNPLADIYLLFDDVIENKEEAHQLVLAIGAALSGMQGINLLTTDGKKKGEFSFQKTFVTVGAGALAFAVFASYVGLNGRLSYEKKKYATVRAEYDDYSARIEEVKERLHTHEILFQKSSWSRVLQDLSHSMPRNMYLTNIDIKNNIIDIEGIILESQTGSESNVSNLIAYLEKGALINVKLVNTQKDVALSAERFTIQGIVK